MNPDTLLWSQYLPSENIVYAQIDEIADQNGMRFAEFAVTKYPPPAGTVLIIK